MLQEDISNIFLKSNSPGNFCKVFKSLNVQIQSNTIEEEFKERLIAGNKAFCANQKMLRRKSLSSKYKLKPYCTLIRPIITCARETWVLKRK
jgi:hypothetical protein